jgi:hypothetical protein
MKARKSNFVDKEYMSELGNYIRGNKINKIRKDKPKTKKKNEN